MISTITEENFSKLDPFFEEYFKDHETDNPNALTQIKQNLKTSFEVKKISLLAVYSHTQEKIQILLGIDLKTGFIMLWNLKESSSEDKQSIEDVIQVGIEHLQKLNFKIIRMTSRFTTGINESVLSKLGFHIYERAKMDLSRENFLKLSPPQSNQHLSFQKWSEEIKEDLIPILVESHFNYNHPDGYVFSQYVGTEGCHNLMKDMEGNRFGQFLPDHSYGCFLDGRLMGGITFLNREGHGYISEIVIDSALKGQHLGKLILFKSIKKWFENNPESPQVDLDVTLKNQGAYNLYKSLGFQEQGRYVFYCWVDPSIHTTTK